MIRRELTAVQRRSRRNTPTLRAIIRRRPKTSEYDERLTCTVGLNSIALHHSNTNSLASNQDAGFGGTTLATVAAIGMPRAPVRKKPARYPHEPVAPREDVGHDRAMHLSIAMWVAIGAGLFGLAMTLLLVKRSAGRMDLGSVSEQWMAQHRAGRADDPQH